MSNVLNLKKRPPALTEKAEAAVAGVADKMRVSRDHALDLVVKAGAMVIDRALAGKPSFEIVGSCPVDILDGYAEDLRSRSVPYSAILVGHRTFDAIARASRGTMLLDATGAPAKLEQRGELQHGPDGQRRAVVPVAIPDGMALFVCEIVRFGQQ